MKAGLILSLAVIGNAVGGLCRHHKVKAIIQPYDQGGCWEAHKRSEVHVKEGHCKDIDDFGSYTVHPYKAHKYPWHERNCTVTVYSEKHCRGVDNMMTNITGQAGSCGNATWDDPKTMARSLKVTCGNGADEILGEEVRTWTSTTFKPATIFLNDASMKPSTSSKGCTQTVTASAKSSSTSLSTKTATTTVLALASSSSKPSTLTKTATVTASPAQTVTKTVTATPSSSPPVKTTTKTVTATPSPSQSSSSVAVVTVKQTTTIVRPPVATVTGSTTVWVAPSSGSTSSKKVVTYTRTIEARETGMKRRQQSAAAAESDAPDAAAALRRRSEWESNTAADVQPFSIVSYVSGGTQLFEVRAPFTTATVDIYMSGSKTVIEAPGFTTTTLAA